MVRQRLIALVVALRVLAASGSAGQTPPGTRSDEDAITAVIAATTDAFSRHDAKAAASGRPEARESFGRSVVSTPGLFERTAERLIGCSDAAR
jgi:hypothetical protein